MRNENDREDSFSSGVKINSSFYGKLEVNNSKSTSVLSSTWIYSALFSVEGKIIKIEHHSILVSSSKLFNICDNNNCSNQLSGKKSVSMYIRSHRYPFGRPSIDFSSRARILRGNRCVRVCVYIYIFLETRGKPRDPWKNSIAISLIPTSLPLLKIYNRSAPYLGEKPRFPSNGERMER